MAGSQGGVLEMAGRTGIARLQAGFGVEKMDKERKEQE
jgi:hypothetical protein